MDNPVERAVQMVGGPTEASILLHVSVAALYKWRKLGMVPDARAAVLLSRATNGQIGIVELAGFAVVEGGAPEPTGKRTPTHRKGRAFQKEVCTGSDRVVQPIDGRQATVGQVAPVEARGQLRVGMVQRPLHVRQGLAAA